MKLKFCFAIVFLFYSCAHVVAPTGGEKDNEPPKIINDDISKKNKQYNLEFTFNEFVVFNDWNKYFYVSPPLLNHSSKKISKKTLSITIQDTLKEKINYFVCLNKCIKDINEGNVLDTLNYLISQTGGINKDTLQGVLYHSYNKNEIENAWVMLFDIERHDSLIFKSVPNYIAKTNNEGRFLFPNITSDNYKIVAITDLDFFYDEKDIIAFHPYPISTKRDSFISLFAFDPIIKIDSASIIDSILLYNDALNDDSLFIIEKTSDTVLQEELVHDDSLFTKEDYGNLSIITKNDGPCVFILLERDKITKEFSFSEPPYLLNQIPAGEYNLKYIDDTDSDGQWTTGSWEEKRPPEIAVNYPTKITIRSNWDLELIWEID